MPKIKNGKFFAELILLSIFSIVTAGLWLDWVRAAITVHFEDHPYVVLGLALTMTLVGILAMQSFFANYLGAKDDKEKVENYVHRSL